MAQNLPVSLVHFNTFIDRLNIASSSPKGQTVSARPTSHLLLQACPDFDRLRRVMLDLPNEDDQHLAEIFPSCMKLRESVIARKAAATSTSDRHPKVTDL